MSGAKDRFRSLWDATRAVADGIPAVRRFAANLPQDPTFVAPKANRLPVHPRLRGMLAQSGVQTRDLANAVVDVIDDAEWQQTYSEAQVGRTFLDAYGWFNIMSPDGPFLSEHWRIALAVWGKGLIYPAHAHIPEELYFVVAGGALFHAADRQSEWLGPGDTRHHPSNVQHGMEFGDTPLVALAFWKGEALMEASKLAPE